MVLDEQGLLRPSVPAYDKRVAGVISGAAPYSPGIVLDRRVGAKHSSNRGPRCNSRNGGNVMSRHHPLAAAQRWRDGS